MGEETRHAFFYGQDLQKKTEELRTQRPCSDKQTSSPPRKREEVSFLLSCSVSGGLRRQTAARSPHEGRGKEEEEE